jgi:hypothetical protein
MFTIDPSTRMTWFQPASLEPLYRFELIGLLISLAIYNGVTLPVTFPNALYRRLLGLKVCSIKHIEDGWGDLVKGFKTMLEWNDGDVRDVFMRTYEFSFNAHGQVYNVNMETVGREEPWSPRTTAETKSRREEEKEDAQTMANSSIKSDGIASAGTPEPKPVSPRLVSNKTRARYIDDYIYWLTDKSIKPQYEAFARGFNVCLDSKAMSLLNPSLLQNIVEGSQEIDIRALERVAKYEDGYTSKHPLIRGFWKIASKYSATKKRQLLEFVTASDRVPVSGMEGITFYITRNGGDSERVPTAMTCFGKLLVPEYASVEKLEQKMNVALANSQGFGSI